MADSMQDTAKPTPAFPMQFQNRNTSFIVVSTNGGPLFLFLSVMTLWNVLHVGIKWSYLNSITTTDAYPLKNSMREPCPNLPERIPLLDFLWYNLPMERKDRIEQQYRGITQKYLDNPPEGMTSEDIRNMSEDDLLDMDYFLNEDDLFADEAGVEGFYIF